MKLPPILPALLALGLAACSGGGADEAVDILMLTGLSAPDETGPAQQARQQGVRARADSLILSTMHVEAALPDSTTLSTQRLAACSGAQCELTDVTSGETETVGIGGSEIPLDAAEAIGSKHGVTLTRQGGSHTTVEMTAFGAWLDHSAFALNDFRYTGGGAGSSTVQTSALGALTGLPPTDSAAWLGLMVGTPTAGEGKGDRLVGDAALNYDMAAGGLDIAFSGIANIDRGTAHATPTVQFQDVPVAADGTFARGQGGHRVQGGFYGPGHAEAAGIFEQSNIVGAFGAKRR